MLKNVSEPCSTLKIKYFCPPLLRVRLLSRRAEAGVVELVDTLDLGSSAARCVGSSPSTRTKKKGHYALSSFLSE